MNYPPELTAHSKKLVSRGFDNSLVNQDIMTSGEMFSNYSAKKMTNLKSNLHKSTDYT